MAGNINPLSLSFSDPISVGGNVVTEINGGVMQGGSGPVSVELIRSGSALCSDACSYAVNDLRPGSTYQFRIRAHNHRQGWGLYSGSSDPVTTLYIPKPSYPGAPIFSSKGNTFISMRLQSGKQVSSTIQYYRVQYEANGSGVWNAIPQTSSADDGWMITVTGLTPGSTVSFISSVLFVVL